MPNKNSKHKIEMHLFTTHYSHSRIFHCGRQSCNCCLKRIFFSFIYSFIYLFRNLCNRQSLNAFLERQNYSCTTVHHTTQIMATRRKPNEWEVNRKVSDEWCVEYANYIIICMIKTIFSVFRAVWWNECQMLAIENEVWSIRFMVKRFIHRDNPLTFFRDNNECIISEVRSECGRSKKEKKSKLFVS